MFKHKILWGVFFTLIFIFSNMYADDWQTILKGVQQKYTGYDNKIKDLTLTRDNKIYTDEGEVNATSKTFKKGVKFRNEMTMQMPEMPQGMPQMKTIVIYDGKDTWLISPFMGKKKLPAEQGIGYKRQEDWWLWLSENGKLIGSESVDGQDCYLVSLNVEEAPFNKIWVTKKEFAVIKAEFKDEKKTGVIRFSDYKKLEGFDYPYQIDIYIDGKLQSSMTIKSVKVNSGLSDDLFDPDKVEMPSMQEMMQQMKKGAGSE